MLRLRSTVRWLCLVLVISLTGLLAVAAEATADAPPERTVVTPHTPVDAMPTGGADDATDTLVDALSDDLGESLLPMVVVVAGRWPVPQPPALTPHDPPFPWTFGLLRPPTSLV